jgi:hypothetical protein
MTKELLAVPGTDFFRVRDQRRTMLLTYDLDLSTARSIAAGTALLLPLAGNSFYVDQDLTNCGFATCHFQDGAFYGSAPVLTGPGFIAKVPFTQINFENAAQPGKRLRIFYGVDVEFVPGVNTQTTLQGNVAVQDVGMSYGASYASTAVLGQNVAQAVFAPGANLNGAILHDASFWVNYGTSSSLASFVAKNAVPASWLDGDVLVQTNQTVGAYISSGRLLAPIRIAAGKGLYYIDSTAGAASCIRSALYTLL